MYSETYSRILWFAIEILGAPRAVVVVDIRKKSKPARPERFTRGMALARTERRKQCVAKSKQEVPEAT